jgi:hypothetical protein
MTVWFVLIASFLSITSDFPSINFYRGVLE